MYTEGSEADIRCQSISSLCFESGSSVESGLANVPSTLASDLGTSCLCLLSAGTAGAWLLWVGSGNATQDLMTSQPILNHFPSPLDILTVAKCKC